MICFAFSSIFSESCDSSHSYHYHSPSDLGKLNPRQILGWMLINTNPNSTFLPGTDTAPGMRKQHYVAPQTKVIDLESVFRGQLSFIFPAIWEQWAIFLRSHLLHLMTMRRKEIGCSTRWQIGDVEVIWSSNDVIGPLIQPSLDPTKLALIWPSF